jgi:hypothetical protein
MADMLARFGGLPLVTHEGRISTMRDLYRAGDVDRALMVAAVIDTALEASRELTLDEDESENRPVVHRGSGIHPTSALAPHTVLRIAKVPDEIAKLPFDHRAGFVLALVDGVTPVESILDIGGMPAEETLSLLQELLVLGVLDLAS